MKAITYLLAAVGLMFLGAVASHLMKGPYLYVESPEPVAAWSQPMGIPASIYNSPAQTAVIHGTWASGAGLAIAVLAMGAMIVGALWGLRRVLQRSDSGNGNESAIVQELYQLGRNLDARMEALETILLERDRPGTGPRRNTL